MSSYPLIADHGLIENLQTAALVSTDGEIDWFYCPRFDSPSVASLLDRERGGLRRIAPPETGYNPEASPDGLRGSEGKFSVCTFWYADALAWSGLGGDRPHRRTARELPSGVQPPRPHQRRRQPERPARPSAGRMAVTTRHLPLHCRSPSPRPLGIISARARRSACGTEKPGVQHG
jgi:hypothetical protein